MWRIAPFKWSINLYLLCNVDTIDMYNMHNDIYDRIPTICKGDERINWNNIDMTFVDLQKPDLENGIDQRNNKYKSSYFSVQIETLEFLIEN